MNVRREKSADKDCRSRSRFSNHRGKKSSNFPERETEKDGRKFYRSFRQRFLILLKADSEQADDDLHDCLEVIHILHARGFANKAMREVVFEIRP